MSRAAELTAALQLLERRLVRACEAAGRERSEVSLIAVSKTHPIEDVATLAALGVRDFGENRDQEAAAKAKALSRFQGLSAFEGPVRWHFVGGLQTNKARSVATYADVVHSVDRAALVQALSAGAVRADRRLDVLLQVGLDDTEGRAGARPEELPALAEQVVAAPGLRLAGVMTVAPLGLEPVEAFDALAAAAARLRADHPDATAISAGMSGDLEEAIAAGATYVRVGTALFGSRPPALR